MGSYFPIFIACFLIAMIAQNGVARAYNQYAQVPNSQRMTGAQAAREFLDSRGLYDVDIQPTRGILSDHYDINNRTLYLSYNVYRDPSISSVAIACHEAGHAVQHAEGYKALTFRNQLLPIVSISNSLCWWVMILGILFQSTTMFSVGVAMLIVIAVFQLATLPVEFNASKRALAYLSDGILMEEELVGAKRVLRSAAFTYVVALLTSMLQIFYFLGLGRRR